MELVVGFYNGGADDLITRLEMCGKGGVVREGDLNGGILRVLVIGIIAGPMREEVPKAWDGLSRDRAAAVVDTVPREWRKDAVDLDVPRISRGGRKFHQLLSLQVEALVDVLARGRNARAVVGFQAIDGIQPIGIRIGAHLIAPLRNMIRDCWGQFCFQLVHHFIKNVGLEGSIDEVVVAIDESATEIRIVQGVIENL